ncbi:MAG: ATP-binding protein [Eggerthellaceae bacterium]|nr:ATP-binding protein [Eggerthellaceae bacterium]
MKYFPRIADGLLDLTLEAFGAALIQGPKGCGKTTTAKQRARTVVEFQDEDVRENLLKIANTAPSKLLLGDKPILFDEWQDAPKVWGAIRKDVDDTGEVGGYLLTGSSSRDADVPHTGTLRISRLQMLPMSLYESGESDGSVSLAGLFARPGDFDGCVSGLGIDELIFAICRGGWPAFLSRGTDRAKLAIAKDLYRQTYSVDISNVDGVRRNPAVAQAVLRSYARNICTPAAAKTVLGDVRAAADASDDTVRDYLRALERLYIVADVDAWCPAIRSKTAIRASRKRNLVDPSIAVAAMGVTPEYFNGDFKTLGFLFESLCIRDLKAYASAFDGRMSYYRDRYGLEADGVLHLNDGRYALIEFKLGESEVEEGALHLCEIERLIKERNAKEAQCPLPLPSLKMVVTGARYGYRRGDGVLVVPIGCLRE